MTDDEVIIIRRGSGTKKSNGRKRFAYLIIFLLVIAVIAYPVFESGALPDWSDWFNGWPWDNNDGDDNGPPDDDDNPDDGEYSVESEIVSNSYIFGLGAAPTIATYGNYLYVALVQLPNLYCAKIDANTLDVMETVKVGTVSSSDSHFRNIGLFVGDNGVLHCTVGYYAGGIYHWETPVSSLNFQGGQTSLSGYSYPWGFAVNGEVHLLLRGSSGLVWATGTGSGARSWATKATMWTWSGGSLQDVCYYHDMYYSNGKAYVAAVGYRTAPSEQRNNLYFGYTDDFGSTWHSMSGSVINSPEQIYSGYTTRCRITAADGEPLIISGYCYTAGSKSDFRVFEWAGSQWQGSKLPLPDGKHSCGWPGCKSVWKVSGTIHCFVGLADQASSTARTTIYHYTLSGGSWEYRDIIDDTSRSGSSTMYNGAFYVLSAKHSSGTPIIQPPVTLYKITYGSGFWWLPWR